MNQKKVGKIRLHLNKIQVALCNENDVLTEFMYIIREINTFNI